MCKILSIFLLLALYRLFFLFICTVTVPWGITSNLIPMCNLIQLLTELLASGLHIVSSLHLNTLEQVLPITRSSLCFLLPDSQHIYYLLADKCLGSNPCQLLNQFFPSLSFNRWRCHKKFSIWKTKPLSLALLCCIEAENKAVRLPFSPLFFHLTLQHLQHQHDSVVQDDILNIKFIQ